MGCTYTSAVHRSKPHRFPEYSGSLISLVNTSFIFGLTTFSEGVGHLLSCVNCTGAMMKFAHGFSTEDVLAAGGDADAFGRGPIA